MTYQQQGVFPYNRWRKLYEYG